MAVPKKRTGHSAQGSRRSNWKATKPETTKCPNCGAAVLAHTVCTACGTYKGKPVSLKDRVEEVAEVKKPAKKTTAKKSTKNFMIFYRNHEVNDYCLIFIEVFIRNRQQPLF